MIWLGQCFGAVGVLAPSMFCAVDVLTRSIFEVPQGMSLAGTVDVLTWSIFNIVKV